MHGVLFDSDDIHMFTYFIAISKSFPFCTRKMGNIIIPSLQKFSFKFIIILISGGKPFNREFTPLENLSSN